MSASIRSITPQQMAERLRDLSAGPLQLIDVREPAELEIVNLNAVGFRNYPLSQYEEWSERILVELDSEQPTFVLCHHGVRSAQMSYWLQVNGFTQVHNISGGIHAWACEVDPSLPIY
ncbi:rhodanese-related sulfurtransferase [Synechococcus sp. Nb3U1]|uniref:rhodanese-like domain-containing protein n=1 Tax=Synechococcus sp. Nb3U1 TaxID=1914529 RepID=UPI001F3C9B8D|nr:rhodanese-like domain-containing protein [Synechococcus sp. Nb3U1]MCF2970624.1 rhodanese-related sulfurtransferase [Synechococcus sp. Nb3U1]